MMWLFPGQPRASVGLTDQANSDSKGEIAKMTMSMSLQGSRADGEEEIKESNDEMMNKALALSLSLQEQSRREKEEEEEILAKCLALSMVEK